MKWGREEKRMRGKRGTAKKRTQCKRWFLGLEITGSGWVSLLKCVHGDQQSKDVRYDAEIGCRVLGWNSAGYD
jgi:hypothetical protein